MKRSKYGEKSNPGTVVIIAVSGLIVFLVLMTIPAFFIAILITIPIFILVNEACKRRRKNSDTGKWEWCPPQKGVSMWNNEGLLGK